MSDTPNTSPSTARFNFDLTWSAPGGKPKTASVGIAAGFMDRPYIIGAAIDRLLGEIMGRGIESDNMLSKIEVSYVGPETNWQKGDLALGVNAIKDAKAKQFAVLNAQS